MNAYKQPFQLNGFYDDYIAPIFKGAKTELKANASEIGKQVVVKYLDKSGALKQVTTTIGTDGKPLMPADYNNQNPPVAVTQQTDYTPYVIAGSVGLIALVAILKKR